MKIDMRQLFGNVTLAAMLGCSPVLMEATTPSHAVAQEIDEGYFYSSLAPHGEWFFQAEFGWVWHPTRVGASWRPYTEGQWVWSDDVGWTWASYEPWGWATYHYGRWYFDPIYGWTWVPGTTWAPAWVSWRVVNNHIGWAPLWPVYFDLYPEYRWNRWHHDDDWRRRHRDRDWDRWVFTRDRDFNSDRISRVVIRDHRERDRLYRDSRDVTRWEDGRPDRIGFSVDRARIESVAREPVRRVRLENADEPMRTNVRGDRLQIYRPRVREAASDRTPDRLGIAKPPREQRATETIKQEKERIERVSGKPARGETVRERDNERGGAPQTVERERGAGRGPGGTAATRADADRRDQRDREGRDATRDSREPRDQTREPRDQKEGRGVTETDQRTRPGESDRGSDGRDERGRPGTPQAEKRDPRGRSGVEQDQRGPGQDADTHRRTGQDRRPETDRAPRGQQPDRGRPATQEAGPRSRDAERGNQAVPRNKEGDAKGGAVLRPGESPGSSSRTGREARPASRAEQPKRVHEPAPAMRRETPQMRREPPAPVKQQERVRPQPAPQKRIERRSAPAQSRPESMDRGPSPSRASQPAPKKVQRAPEPRVQQPARQSSPAPRGERAPAKTSSPRKGEPTQDKGPPQGRGR